VNEEIPNLMDVDFCKIGIFDKVHKKMVLYTKKNSAFSKNEAYLESFIKKGLCINSESDIRQEKMIFILNSNLKANYRAIPLMGKNGLFGVIFVYRKDGMITENQFKDLTIAADNISMALNNASLHSKMNLGKKRKYEFLAYWAHEFKTPLHAIMGFTSLMKSSAYPREKQMRYLENILRASKHLLEVAEYAIDVARSGSDSLRLYYERFDAAGVLQEVLMVLEEKFKDKGIKVTTSLSKTEITADRRKFRQLIYNLTSNALKYNKLKGKIYITTSSDDEHFYFKIRNTGKCITAQEQERIFQFFSDTENKGYEEEDSSGLGLSLCKKIIELHNGKIDFNSHPDTGTTFRFMLPLTECTSKEHL
jgi:signal transduction histidine kinase